MLVAGAMTAGGGSQTDAAPPGPIRSEQASLELVPVAAIREVEIGPDGFL
jgi:hypothetical protein